MIATSLSAETIAGLVASRFGASSAVSRAAVIVSAIALAAPFFVGILRITGRLVGTLAEAALPEPSEARVDLAAAPRRALAVTLQLAVTLLVGLPLLALTQPFLPGPYGAVVLGLLLLVLGLAFWRSATNLQGHVKAGTEMIVEVLAKQARKGAAAPDDRALAPVGSLLPGLGEPVPFRVDARSVAAGRTLAELDLRGLTGATVLAIIREGRGSIAPTAREELRAGDVLALAGSHAAVEAAKDLLQGREPVR